MEVPVGIEAVLDEAWEVTKHIPGFLVEDEARFLGLAAACSAQIGGGRIVEIGSFKGRSTVMLAKVARHYGLPPVVAIDPHTFDSAELQEHRSSPSASSYSEFLSSLESAGVSDMVEVRRAYSAEVAAGWERPISFLWIDGDHTYQGARLDFDGFAPYLLAGGIIAFHDALHEFAGPIRVFVEDVLGSARFGAAGFVRSIAWSQFRPEDGGSFDPLKRSLARAARRLIPFTEQERPMTGLRKIAYKLNRARVPRSLPEPLAWVAKLDWKAESQPRA